VPSSAAAGRGAVISLPSATSEPFVTRSSPGPAAAIASGFPKDRRLLRRSEFRRVYDEGTRVSSPFFAAFLLSHPERADGPRVGFTIPRAVGKAVVRNRIRRRLREIVRVRLAAIGPKWDIVFNPRRAALLAPALELAREVDRVIARCQLS
jgi:ribonuclease P protein component